MPTTDTEQVKALVALRKQRQALEADLVKVKAKIDEAEPLVLDWMQENAVQKVTQDGLTVSLRRELWASVNPETGVDFLKEALASAGLDPSDIVKEKANSQTLSSLIREYDHSGEVMPNMLAAAVKVSEVYKLAYRAS